MQSLRAWMIGNWVPSHRAVDEFVDNPLREEVTRAENEAHDDEFRYGQAHEAFQVATAAADRSELLTRVNALNVRRTASWQKANEAVAALQASVERQLLEGRLIARGFSGPHHEGDKKVVIPAADWGFLRFFEHIRSGEVHGREFKYVKVEIGRWTR